MRLGKRARTPRADVDVGRRSGDAGVLGGFLLQLVGVFTRDPTLLDLVSVSLLLGLGWLGLVAVPLPWLRGMMMRCNVTSTYFLLFCL